ncbi:biotin carboxylase N-terminal domain-containing protein [Parvularcula sp. IMCC14364]|uniref:ATP-binding protein n=1 Tax=Parvularcula sp. IMCC14364 TaxID=3067902 RepID=UPI002741483D|nr:biotin carboxylase N-terminal domain-containing protein [Parvularcula sp. IMCC14364]
MFKSILVANRGEIACRIMRTAKRMGLRTIAVYSDADKNALHVREADEAVHIGPPPPSESYLQIDRIIDAALKSGAEAIHPGYGFLSENTKFAEELAKTGITFVGPDASCIAAMGDKIESKRLAEEAGVPGVPGYAGNDQSNETLIQAAERIGFPVMVKASAGGGGKGMRRVFERKELEEAIDLARREGKSSFGDDRLLVEKLITRPRHLEIQIAGDKHGNVIHLLERDCSVQRNNQKVLEEAPAPNLSDAVRQKLFDRAVQLAKAINYNSLGTVEFIMDAGDDEPAFLEMNTRLQVEHPVTEYITGLDLVELQIRIAAGEPLPLVQGDVQAKGHAIEARVTAEKPAQNFLPDIGHIHHIKWPRDIRIDTGVQAGSEISQFYDSMIAKVIAEGDNRQQACDRLISALRSTAIMGVESNVAFLADCAAAPDFYNGEATTSFLGEVFPQGWQADESEREEARIFAAVIWQSLQAQKVPFHGFRALRGAGLPARSFLTVEKEGTDPVDLVLAATADGYCVTEEVTDTDVRVIEVSRNEAVLMRNGYRQKLVYAVTAEHFYLGLNGLVRTYRIMPTVEYARALALGGAGSGEVISDMPGSIAEVKVSEGDMVEAGAPLVVMESMKLLITLNASVAGKVIAVNVTQGDLINAGDVLVVVESEE